MDAKADAPSPETGSAQHVLPAGAVLGGRFRLLGALSAPSPHAVVYRAEGDGGEALAVKEFLPTALVGRLGGDPTLRPHDPAAAARMADARRRFVLEAQLLEAVDHPGLPRVHGHLEANGTAYLVTELIGGRTLEQLLAAGGRFAAPDAGHIALALLEALEVLHAQGILHRDVAPANVLLGADERPRILGLATPRQLLMYGTPGAVAPRQGFAAIEMYGSRGKGPWTDVHGVAALLYYLLTGSAPTSAVDRAAGEGLVPPSRLVAGVPWAVDALVMKGLAQRSEDRPHSAERFRALLEEALAGSRVGMPGSYSPAASQTPVGALAVVPQAATPTAPGIVAISHAPATAYAPPAHPTSRLASPPTSAPAIQATPLGPAALSLLTTDDGELTDDELQEDDLLAGSNLGFDAASGALVLPREPQSMTRLLQWGAAGAAMLVVVALVTRALVGGPDRVTLEASAAPPAAVRATPAATPAPGPASSPAVGPASAPVEVARADGVRPAGVAAAAPPVIAAPAEPTRTRDGSALESRRPSASEPQRREESELRVDVPRVQLPAITASLPSAKQPVPLEAMAQLEDALSAARARADAGDYSGAQAALRTLDARIDDTAERYLSSSGLDGLRRRVDRERQRARDACLALNFIARRRNGRILVCE